METKRIEWIDILKGIGIVLVVIGHISVPEYFVRLIFVFHMPLFFFLSGYLYKKRGIIDSFKKSSLHLLLPYLSMAAIVVTLTAIFLKPFICDHPLPCIQSIIMVIARNGRFLDYASSPLWFLPCLFLTQVIYNALQKYCSQIALNSLILIALIFVYAYNQIYGLQWLPWNIQVTLFSIPIFHIGHLYRQWQAQVKINPYLLLLLVVAIATSIYFFPDNTMDMYNNNFGIPFITLLCSIVFILFFKNIAVWLEQFDKPSAFFTSLGKASITIMGFHLLIYNLFSGPLFDSLVAPIALILNFVTTLSLSYLLYVLFKQFRITRLLFLGENK